MELLLFFFEFFSTVNCFVHFEANILNNYCDQRGDRDKLIQHKISSKLSQKGIYPAASDVVDMNNPIRISTETDKQQNYTRFKIVTHGKCCTGGCDSNTPPIFELENTYKTLQACFCFNMESLRIHPFKSCKSL